MIADIFNKTKTDILDKFSYSEQWSFKNLWTCCMNPYFTTSSEFGKWAQILPVVFKAYKAVSTSNSLADHL